MSKKAINLLIWLNDNLYGMKSNIFYFITAISAAITCTFYITWKLLTLLKTIADYRHIMLYYFIFKHY